VRCSYKRWDKTKVGKRWATSRIGRRALLSGTSAKGRVLALRHPRSAPRAPWNAAVRPSDGPEQGAGQVLDVGLSIPALLGPPKSDPP